MQLQKRKNNNKTSVKTEKMDCTHKLQLKIKELKEKQLKVLESMGDGNE